jgi:alpha,alpha-trehalose phosphorylase
VLQHERSVDEGTRSVRAYRTSSSRMGVVVGVDHQLDTPDHVAWDHEVQESNDRVRHLFQGRLTAHTSVRLVKTSAYDFSGSSGADELVDRCVQQLNQQQRRSETERWVEQRAFLDDFWRRSYLEVGGVPPQTQQAINWNLFQLAQSSARADGRGIPAKGLTGSGYSGHYFWDSEVYVSPFLVFTSPQWARNALRFRASLLPSARRRAAQMNEEGALFAWRTINGEEASAYYAAGTAQYHINADITYALTRYVRATGDAEFIAGSAGDVAIETARMWMSLGFWRTEADGSEAFHIHGVTGPDEYTTVVNDNLYTNVMARYNLRSAIDLLDFLKHNDPDHGLQKMVERLHITDEEIEQWRRAEHGMSVPYDEDEHIHPQDAHFLEREVWDLEATPPEQKPLLLHFHPLVIYRFQVLKQADVVLAMLLASQDFTEEEKQRNFEYYDQLTTGDSSLSAVVQSIIAAEVGYRTAAFEYFEQALRVDLDDLHSNTGDGVHIASAGGVWLCLVQGFAGMRDVGGNLRFDPRLPEEWTSLSFTMKWRGSRICVELTQSELAFTHVKGAAEVPIQVRGVEHVLHPAGELRVELKDQGPNLGELKRAIGATQDHGYADDGEYEYITTEIPTIEFWEA